MVEHNLAKVGVASSNLVSRSNLMQYVVKKLLLPVASPRGRNHAVAGYEYRFPLQFNAVSSKEVFTTGRWIRISFLAPNVAEWQNGYAADCKSVDLGSTPGSASIYALAIPACYY